MSKRFSQIDHLKPEHENLYCAFSKYLSEAENEYKKVIKLLKKNDAYDNLNKERDNNVDEELNRLVVQMTDTLMKIQQLMNKND